MFNFRRILLAIALAGLVLAAYLPVWHAGFVWDDDAHLTANPCVVGPLGVAGAWTTAAGGYFPLVVTHFWVLYHLWGLAPLGYHGVTLLMHLGCGWLLWRCLEQLRIPGAWFGAALWAIHPVQVESVAWVSEFVNTQSGVFFLAALSLYLARMHGFAFACGLAAMLSKPSTVALPVVLALGHAWLGRPWSWKEVLRLVPYVAAGAATSAWAIWEQHYHQGAIGAAWSLSAAQRLLIAGRAVWFYLGKLLSPHALSFVYPRWQVNPHRLMAWLPVLAVGAVCGVGAWGYRARRPWARPFGLAAVSFLAALFPVLGFFDVYYFRYSFVADHFQYLASMAPLAAVGAGLRRWTLVLLAPLGALTLIHARDFTSDQRLWEATLAADPNSWIAHNNLAVILAHQPGHEAEADFHAKEAVRINPDDAEAEYNLATMLDRQPNRTAEAIARYRTAIRLDPRDPHWHFKLAFDLGKSPEGRTEAEAEYREATRLAPDYIEARNNLGILLAGDPATLPEAVSEYEAALRASPSYAPARQNLVIAERRWAYRSFQAGRLDDAAQHLRRLLELDPADQAAQTNLARIEAASGQKP